MADVRRLSAHVIKLRDMPEGVLVLSGLSRVWKSHVYDPVLQGADGNGTRGGLWGKSHDFHFSVFLSGPVLRSRRSLILMLGRPFKGFPFTALLPLRTILLFRIPLRRILPLALPVPRLSVLAQPSGRTTCHSFFVGNDDESDDDDDACVEILLVTPLRSAVVIPSSGNQGGSSAASTTKGSNLQDSR
ncbi:hypothetical protein Tco_0805084, partial [Tanacetum coccineum]